MFVFSTLRQNLNETDVLFFYEHSKHLLVTQTLANFVAAPLMTIEKNQSFFSNRLTKTFGRTGNANVGEY